MTKPRRKKLKRKHFRSVKVKPGVKDYDFGIDIGGWQGRVIEMDGENITVAWDSITLRNMSPDIIRQSELEGLDWSRYTLPATDVIPAKPRDTEADVKKTIEEIAEKHAWDYLADTPEGALIGQVLQGVDPYDEYECMEAWMTYLQAHLTFPFQAEVAEFQERGPLQAGDKVKVLGLKSVEAMYGIIVKIRRGFRRFYFPLCDLEVVDEEDPNYAPVKAYAIWFANRF